VGDLSFDRLTKAWRNLTVGGQARVGLVLAKEGGDKGERCSVVWGGVPGREGARRACASRQVDALGESGERRACRLHSGGPLLRARTTLIPASASPAPISVFTPKTATLNAILKSLMGSFRVAGRTAYVAAGPGERGAAGARARLAGPPGLAALLPICLPCCRRQPLVSARTPSCRAPRLIPQTLIHPPHPLPPPAPGLGDNALALLLMTAAGSGSPDTNPLAQKLAAYVAEGPARSRYGSLFINLGGFDAALAARALAAYDQAAASTAPDLRLRAEAVGNASAVRAGVFGGRVCKEPARPGARMQPLSVCSHTLASYAPPPTYPRPRSHPVPAGRHPSQRHL
jgi:hypothetical protein